MFSIHKPSKMVVISGKASCYCSRETQEGQSEGWNTAWFGRKEAWIEYRVSERLETTMFFCEVCKLTRWVTTFLATSLEIPCQFGDMSISLTSKSDPTDLCGMVMPQDQKICRLYIPSNLHCLYLSLYHLVFGPVNTKTSHLNNRYGNFAMDNAFLVNFGAWSFGVHCSTDIVTSEKLWSCKFDGKFTLRQRAPFLWILNFDYNYNNGRFQVFLRNSWGSER